MEQHIKVVQNGDTLTLRTGEAPEVFQYEGYSYCAATTDSMARLIRAKAKPEHCVIFCDDTMIKAIMDDTIIDRPQDTIWYGYPSSVIAKEWKGVFSDKGRTFEIKELSDFLKRREPGEVEGIDAMLYAVQNFKYTTNTTGDFSFEDRNNYTFNVKVAEAEGTVKIPKILIAHLELIEGSGFLQDIEVEVEYNRPREQKETPRFLLSCPKYPRYYQLAIQHERDRLVELLPEYMIVSGCVQ